MDYELSEEQKKAVYSEGTTLVLAGPGTGKTHTMIGRALHLIIDCHVPPEEIMMVTYTVKASKELVTRLTNELSARHIEVNLHEMYIGTFHHICRLILKEFREYMDLPRNFFATDQFEQQYLVYEALPEFETIPDFRDVVEASYFGGAGEIPISPWKQADKVCQYVNGLEEELVDPEDLVRLSDRKARVLGWMMKKYSRIARDRNFVDYTRLQTETYQLLTKHPEVLQKLRGRIRYIMVDEYQDTDFIQEQLIRLFCGDSGHLFVVGDDDQSLYRFRGATVENILTFDKRYPDCRDIQFTINRRSNKGIIGFFMNWMANPAFFSWERNGVRYRHLKGAIRSPRTDTGVSVVKITTHNDERTLGKRVADFVYRLKEEGWITDYNQVAFLFDSVRFHSSLLQAAMRQRGIPVYAPRAGHFFERKEIANLLGILLLLFPDFSGHMDRFHELDEPIQGGQPGDTAQQYTLFMTMAEETMEAPENVSLRAWFTAKEKELSGGSARQPVDLLSMVYEILSLPPFHGWMDKAAEGESPEARNLSNFTRLVARFGYFLSANHGHGHETGDDITLFFSRYLRLWRLNGVSEYEDEEAYAPSGSVSFLNIHQSKGLEYPVVIVPNLTEVPRWQDDLVQKVKRMVKGGKPYEPPADTKDFDFRRKYYTAFSRAETLLVLACDYKEDRRGKPLSPSFPFAPLLDRVGEYREDMDFSGLKFRSIKNNRFKPRFAFTTQVALYEECPLKYKWRRIYRFAPSGGAALYGILVHETIEDIHRHILRGEEAAVTPDAVYSWMMSDYVSLSKSENTWLTQNQLHDAFQEIMGYVYYRKQHGGIVEAAEFPLELVEKDYVMDGTIDLVEGRGGAVDVVDFKTGKKPAPGSALMERYRSQLMVYAYLIEKKAEKKVGRLILYFTGEDDPMVVFPMDRDKVEARIAAFRDTARHILAEDFNHKVRRTGPGLPEACRYCEWKRYCWGWDGVRE